MRILTPTENKRFNEMIGFVGLSLAVLLALSLLSYSPHDASFNVSARACLRPARRATGLGPWGRTSPICSSSSAAYSAFLFPVGMFLVAMRWFRSQLLEAPVAKLIGWRLLLLFAFRGNDCSCTCPTFAARCRREACSAPLLAEGLRAAFNPVGANLVSIATLLTALFLTTSFSFSAAACLAEEADGHRRHHRQAGWRA